MNIREIAVTVKDQGAVVVNDAVVVYESDCAIAIELDLKSKYCDLTASVGHGVMLGTTEYSLHLNEEADRDRSTWVEFDLPPGKWRFFCGGVSRYTFNAVFLKEEKA